MTHHHLRHVLGHLLLVTGISTALPAAAESEGQHVGIEANQISVSFGGEAGGGKVRVEGCRQCPLELSVDSGTKFNFNGAATDRKQAKIRSGQAGTVVYEQESKHVIEIHW